MKEFDFSTQTSPKAEIDKLQNCSFAGSRLPFLLAIIPLLETKSWKFQGNRITPFKMQFVAVETHTCFDLAHCLDSDVGWAVVTAQLPVSQIAVSLASCAHSVPTAWIWKGKRNSQLENYST